MCSDADPGFLLNIEADVWGVGDFFLPSNHIPYSAAAPIRTEILLKDGPITAFISSKARSIKFELLKDCLRIGDGDWCGMRRDRAAIETRDVCRRELWRSRVRARPLL